LPEELKAMPPRELARCSNQDVKVLEKFIRVHCV
jgi:hypothetical protein